MKESQIPVYLRRIWRDSRVPSGALVVLLEMKAIAKEDVLTILHERLAKACRISVSQLKRHLTLLARLRVISIRHNVSRGNLTASTYLIDDRHFAKFLSETARPKKGKNHQLKNELQVPSVLYKYPDELESQDTDRLREDQKIIPMPGMMRSGKENAI